MRLENVDPAKFWSRVQRGEADQCWTWTGARRGGMGYGQLCINRTWIGAHRIAYMLQHGVQLSRTQQVCHRCDNPICCNPAHLFVGSAADNSADKCRKGRQAKGERVGGARLTEAQVVEIRRRLATGESQARIGKDFGVHQVTVYRIGKGRIWRHSHPDAVEPATPERLTELLAGCIRAGDFGEARSLMSRLWLYLRRAEKKDSLASNCG